MLVALACSEGAGRLNGVFRGATDGAQSALRAKRTAGRMRSSRRRFFSANAKGPRRGAARRFSRAHTHRRLLSTCARGGATYKQRRAEPQGLAAKRMGAVPSATVKAGPGRRTRARASRQAEKSALKEVSRQEGENRHDKGVSKLAKAETPNAGSLLKPRRTDETAWAHKRLAAGEFAGGVAAIFQDTCTTQIVSGSQPKTARLCHS